MEEWISLRERRRRKIGAFAAMFILLMEDEICRHPMRRRSTRRIFQMEMVWQALLERFRPPLTLRTNCILQGNVNFFFRVADSASLQKVTRLNRSTFEILYARFRRFWESNPLLRRGGHVRLRKRKLKGRAVLGVTLFFLAHAPPYTALQLFAGISQSSITRYLRVTFFLLLSFIDSLSDGNSNIEGLPGVL